MSDVELEVTALAAGGDGVARDDEGRVTFVPRTAPGDRAFVKLVEQKKRFARGELVRLVRPSPDRVEPPCPHFLAGCGGCQWQHVARPAQLAAKQAIVEGALRKLPGLVVETIADPAPPYGWRRRARFHVAGGKVGLFAYATNRVIPIDHCPQLEPALDEALGAAIAKRPPDGELTLLLGHTGDVATSLDNRVIEIEPDLFGDAHSFAQASAAGNARLIELSRRALGAGPGTLLELFAGSGNLTRAFVADGWDVLASDVAAPIMPIAGARFEIGSAQEVSRRAKGPFDAIVLDPPRTGAIETIDHIVRHKPRVIVYVSCDPATLARDAEELVAAGYRAERAWPVDMMPQTSHVEVVMKLSLSESA